MQAVLQSLADICGEELSGVQQNPMQQGSFRADAAPPADADSSVPGCSDHSPPASPSHTASLAPAGARMAQHHSQQQATQDRLTASQCRLKAGVRSVVRRTRRAAQLTRLKGTLRRAQLPRAALGAALAGAAQDTTSNQSAIAANTPASPEQDSSPAVEQSSGRPESRLDQRGCVSEAPEGPQRRMQQPSGHLMSSTSLSWRTQQSEGSRGFTAESFSATGAAEHLLEESPPGTGMSSSSDPPAMSMKRFEKRPPARASPAGATGEDCSSGRRLAMRELKAAKLRVGGTESATTSHVQERSYLAAENSQDPSAERRQDRRPKHVVREASSGMALRPSQVTIGRIHPSSTAAEVYSSMPSRCSANVDDCLVLHAGRARHRHAHAVRSRIDRTQREYRRQKAIAAKLRAEEPRREQAPPRCASRQTLHSAGLLSQHAACYIKCCSDPICMTLFRGLLMPAPGGQAAPTGPRDLPWGHCYHSACQHAAPWSSLRCRQFSCRMRRREGVTERRRRLTAEAGLTDSLLFSSDSECNAGLSSDCGSNGSGSAPKHVTGTHSTLSSLSSAASTPRACMEPSTPERTHAQGGSSTPDVLTPSSSHADTSLKSRCFLAGAHLLSSRD